MPFKSERAQIGQNIEAVLKFYTREDQKISRSQRIVERISLFAGRPLFLALILVFVASWMLANVLLHQMGMAEFDPAPFFWLQGGVGLGLTIARTCVEACGGKIAAENQPPNGLCVSIWLARSQPLLAEAV